MESRSFNAFKSIKTRNSDDLIALFQSDSELTPFIEEVRGKTVESAKTQSIQRGEIKLSIWRDSAGARLSFIPKKNWERFLSKIEDTPALKDKIISIRIRVHDSNSGYADLSWDNWLAYPPARRAELNDQPVRRPKSNSTSNSVSGILHNPEQFSLEVNSQISSVNTQLSSVQNSVNTQISSIQSDLHRDNKELARELTELRTELRELKVQLNRIEELVKQVVNNSVIDMA